MTQLNNQNSVKFECGRGMFKQKFFHYEDIPVNEAKKVINHFQTERALGN